MLAPVWRVPAFAVDESAGVVVDDGRRAGLVAAGEGVDFVVSREVRVAVFEPWFRDVLLGFWVTVFAGSLLVLLAVAAALWRAGLVATSPAGFVDVPDVRGLADTFGLAGGTFDALLVARLFLARCAFDGRSVTVLAAGL